MNMRWNLPFTIWSLSISTLAFCGLECTGGHRVILSFTLFVCVLALILLPVSLFKINDTRIIMRSFLMILGDSSNMTIFMILICAPTDTKMGS